MLNVPLSVICKIHIASFPEKTRGYIRLKVEEPGNEAKIHMWRSIHCIVGS